MNNKKRRTIAKTINPKKPKWNKNLLGTKPCIRKIWGQPCRLSASCPQCRERLLRSPLTATSEQILREHNDPTTSNRETSLGDQPTTEQTEASLPLPSSYFSSNCQPLHSSISPHPLPPCTHPHLFSLSSTASPHNPSLPSSILSDPPSLLSPILPVSPSLMLPPHAPSHSYIAQSGGTNFAPQLSNNFFSGPVNISMPSHQRVDLSQAPQGSDQEDGVLQRVKANLKARMKSRCEHLFEGNSRNETPLKNIYTELYITAGETEGVCNEHEVLQIETASRTCTSEDTPINCNDIFKPLPGQNRIITTVMTKGIAGIGKTVTVQKFILDWAEGKANQHLDFIFLLPFRELNLFKKQSSLHSLLCGFYHELGDIEDANTIAGCQVLFIFDGLDESRFALDFNQNETLFDIAEEAPIDVLLTNLIKGNLSPRASLWITSRPAAANKIPRKNITKMTEVRGFNDLQEEEYFRKRFCSDAKLANRIISHIKTTRSLNIMCHIPVFCWITATVLWEKFRDDCKEIPKTLSEMYTHFVLIQTNLKNQKYHNIEETDARRILKSDKEIILKLAKLAFEHLTKSNFIFYEKDLRECGIDIKKVSVQSGLCTEIFKQEVGLYSKTVYCFLHLTIQEYFAALYLLYCYTTDNMEVLKSFLNDTLVEEDSLLSKHVGYHLDASQRDGPGESLESDQLEYCEEISTLEEEPEEHCLLDDEAVEGSDSESSELVLHEKPAFHVLLKSAVLNALESENGHLDIMLRFLLGLSLDSNQILLQDLLPEMESCAESVEETKKYIKEMLRYYKSPERCINLLFCLAEINDNTLLEEVQAYLRPGNHGGKKLSPEQCTALAYVLMSTGILHEFDPKKYNTSEEGQWRMIPVVKCCINALLSNWNITEKLCGVVASALKSSNSPLQKLDLSYNYLQNSSMDLICAGLSSQHCKLKILRLNRCNLTAECCSALESALSSDSSHLRDLDLSDNELQDSGVKLLSAGLQKLETLKLSSCGVTKEGCTSLASALRSNISNLRELDLSDNDLYDSGVKLLSAVLGNPHCKLETLRLSGCIVSEEGCASLTSALRSNASNLRELDLSYNHPGDTGVRLLSAAREDPHFILNVEHNEECYLKSGLKKYACALTLDPNTTHRKLSLSNSGRTVICEADDHPYCPHIERFDDCPQVLCREVLTGRCYWEAEWSGRAVSVGVAYKDMSRVGKGHDCLLGYNDKSWSLRLLKRRLYICHNNTNKVIPVPSSCADRVGVYLNSSQGTLSFYLVSSDTLTHLHTFHSTFTEPLYPAFSVNDYSSVSLC
ncbi:protein NLRC3-like isoform X1 [Salvelinus alpinus]|uniref:protein NLRC3-like isoform X1 n=1 Tax=Salvelinus alpinus TaxID=8036 RepID=UPI0039FC1582